MSFGYVVLWDANKSPIHAFKNAIRTFMEDTADQISCWLHHEIKLCCTYTPKLFLGIFCELHDICSQAGPDF